MKMKQAYRVAELLFSSGVATAWLKRRRKSPRYSVGYTNLHTGKATCVATSNVSWKNCFFQYAMESAGARGNIIAAMQEAGVK